MDVNLYGAALEFKIDILADPSSMLPQAFADMVRVCNDLLIDA